jgi:hypothetical protein
MNFGDVVVITRGGTQYNATVLAVKQQGVKTLLDLGYFVPVITGEGKPVNVVGTSRQSEMSRFDHDVPAEECHQTTDWFFELTDGELAQLLNERTRRQNEAAEKIKAAEAERARKAQTEGVVIKPSEKLMTTAKELWTEDLRTNGHLGIHEEAHFPDYATRADLWKPWLDKARAALNTEVQTRQDELAGNGGGQAESKAKAKAKGAKAKPKDGDGDGEPGGPPESSVQ